jgi:hypothetical protein
MSLHNISVKAIVLYEIRWPDESLLVKQQRRHKVIMLFAFVSGFLSTPSLGAVRLVYYPVRLGSGIHHFYHRLQDPLFSRFN